MEAAPVTWPKVAESSVVLMPLYWTVLKTLLAVTRASKERVSPSWTVRERAAETRTLPGPSME